MRGALERLALTYNRNFPIDYGKQWLDHLITVTRGKNVRFRGAYNCQYEFELSERTQDVMFRRGVHERNTLRHIMKLITRGRIRPNSAFADVGANIGAYTLPLAMNLPAGQVLAFEPNPNAVEILARQVALNGLQNVSICPFGLSDRAGSALLHRPRMGTASLHKHLDSEEKIDIPLRTLDECCAERGIERLSVLKIDVEGHESNVLAGAAGIIEASNDLVVVMEIDSNAELVGGREALFGTMLGLGFAAYVPKGAPFGMRRIEELPAHYEDNVIFAKGGV